LPFKAILLAMPNLKEKRRILEELDKANQPNPANQIKEKLTLDNAQAEIFETQMSGELKKAQAIKTGIEAQLAPAQMQQDAINEQQNREERFAMKGADMSERNIDRQLSLNGGGKVDIETATQLLNDAIELHAKHMGGTAPTTGAEGERSQEKMMKQLNAARAALGSSTASPMNSM